MACPSPLCPRSPWGRLLSVPVSPGCVPRLCFCPFPASQLAAGPTVPQIATAGSFLTAIKSSEVLLERRSSGLNQAASPEPWPGTAPVDTSRLLSPLCVPTARGWIPDPIPGWAWGSGCCQPCWCCCLSTRRWPEGRDNVRMPELAGAVECISSRPRFSHGARGPHCLPCPCVEG